MFPTSGEYLNCWEVLDLWDLMANRSVGQNTILCSATINACVTELVGILLRASELSWQNKVLGLCQPHDVDLQFLFSDF